MSLTREGEEEKQIYRKVGDLNSEVCLTDKTLCYLSLCFLF